MHVLWAASRKTKGKYVIGSTPQQSVFRENSTLFGNGVTQVPLQPPPPHHRASKKFILHFTLSSFCAFHAYKFCHSVSLYVYSYFDFSHPQTSHANIITQDIPPSSFFRRYQSVYCNSNLMTSCMHILPVFYVTRVTWRESGCSRAITSALLPGVYSVQKHLAGVTVALHVKNV